MEKYMIYCTEEQTKKALELGAPIEVTGMYKVPQWVGVNDTTFKIPTAEEMIGWIEDCYNDIDITIESYSKERWAYFIGWHSSSGYYQTRKEATLAAIDAALDYLIKARKE